MVEGGLEIYFLKFLHAQSLLGPITDLLHKREGFSPQLQIQ